MNKSYILFDLDGTLTDPKVGITKSVEYSLKSFGIVAESLDSLLPFIGPPLRDSYKKFYGFSDAEAETAVAKYREYFAETGIFENTLYPGIADMLKALVAQGKTLVLATSKPAVYAAKILGHFGIDGCFAFVSGSELDGTRSKKAEVIAHAFANCKVSAKQHAIMVGDKEHDIFGAKAAGIESIGVLYGYGSRAELAAAGADYLAEKVGGLAALLCE